VPRAGFTPSSHEEANSAAATLRLDCRLAVLPFL